MSDLYNKLREYSQCGAYPFHMPGHKRNKLFKFCNPFEIDITEIDGFDDLHRAEGILKECMEYAAECYGSDRTYFLVNGSTSGILSAVSAVADYGDKILVGRNCHKSVYNAAELRGLGTVYVYPEYISGYGITGGINPAEVEELLEKNRDIKTVVIVSPTYDGICSDIKKIADIVHRHEGVLIVDEAHGAHFRYNDYFPESSLNLGADIIIQSLHKTLPSFTQTALLHVKSERVDTGRLEKYLSVYQSSSPSYVFMAGIDKCIRWMEGEGKQYMENYCSNLKKLRKRLGHLNNIVTVSEDIVDKFSVKALDCGKIIISIKDLNAGRLIYDVLRLKYNIQPEMCTDRCVTLMTSVGDSKEAIDYLGDVLCELDVAFEDRESIAVMMREAGYGMVNNPSDIVLAGGEIALHAYSDLHNEQVFSLAEAAVSGKEEIDIDKSIGRISGDYVYIYPPGIPILTPGERISRRILDVVYGYMDAGLNVRGIEHKKILVMDGG